MKRDRSSGLCDVPISEARTRPSLSKARRLPTHQRQERAGRHHANRYETAPGCSSIAIQPNELTFLILPAIIEPAVRVGPACLAQLSKKSA